MLAMVLPRPGLPLEARDVLLPVPGPGEVRLRVAACGVCRTDLHVVDGELPFLGRPLVPGHEIVGRVEAVGTGCGPVPAGRSGRRPLAGLDLRHLPVLHLGAGEPLRARALHGLPPRRRLRRGGGGRRPLLPSPLPEALRRRRRPRRSCALGSSATAPGLRCAATRRASGCTASAPPRTSSRSSPATRASACSPSPGRDDLEGQAFARSLGAEWAGGSDEPVPSRSTPPSSSPRSARWCPRPSGRWTRVARSSAPGST